MNSLRSAGDLRALNRRANALRAALVGCPIPNHVDAGKHALLLMEHKPALIVERAWLYQYKRVDFRGILAAINEAQSHQSPKELPALIWIDSWLACDWFPMLFVQRGGQA
jgi:hypothetical protein